MKSKNKQQREQISASQAIEIMQKFCKSIGLDLVHEQPDGNRASIHFVNKPKKD